MKITKLWISIWFCCSGLCFMISYSIFHGFGIVEGIFFGFLGGYLFAVWWLYPLWRQAKLKQNRT